MFNEVWVFGVFLLLSPFFPPFFSILFFFFGQFSWYCLNACLRLLRVESANAYVGLRWTHRLSSWLKLPGSQQRFETGGGTSRKGASLSLACCWFHRPDKDLLAHSSCHNLVCSVFKGSTTAHETPGFPYVR